MRNRKKFLIFLPLILLPVPTLAAACQQTQKGIQIDENIINKKYLSNLTLQQIASLNEIKQFLFNNEKGNKVYLSVKQIDERQNDLIFENDLHYKPDFKTQQPFQQINTKYDNIKVQTTDNPKNDISQLFTEYNFEEIKKYNGYGNKWFYYLANLKGIDKDFYRVGDPYFFDFQTIIFRLVDDLKNNSGLVRERSLFSSNRKAILLENVFKNQYIQAKSWLKRDDIKEIFIKYLILYLNKFNLGIKKINIDWSSSTIKESIDKNTNFVSFKIKDIITFENKSIITDEIRNKTFYINNFRNYATNLKFGVGESGLKEKLPLFNDYVQNPLLNISSLKFLPVVDNINNFIKGYGSLNYWNSRGIVYLFSKFKNQILSLDIPDIYKENDLKYEIEDVKFTNYFATDQIIKLIIKVIKKDGSFKRYVLLSSNFDDHGHYLRAIALKNLPINLLKPQDYYIYSEHQLAQIKGIKIADFIDIDPNKPFKNLVQNAIDKVYEKWNNRNSVDVISIKKTDESLQVLVAYLNNYLLSYAIENDGNKIHSGIKKIELANISSDEPGTLVLNLEAFKFLDENDINFTNENEKPFYQFSIKLNGFKNYKGTSPNSFSLISKGEVK
ncbi:hypothetical protein DA803_02510 [[Mycoplasma] phocae]|uniref:Lipoprotein n=1 Tax=[Mycoplasma] phocae TaxID=142651 RepID=A0A2Z5IQV9_9BACT|nr:hypothetical protein [[Mycoplasma] phocae]AXE60944.1 hypothetical protein DA803_02510 [[Mycoplasma] phocae]